MGAFYTSSSPLRPPAPKAADQMQNRGLAVQKIGDSIEVTDPDRAQILLVAGEAKQRASK